MDQSESALEQAQRHVREGGERIARQEALIERLDQDGHENLLPAARELLTQMEAAQGLSCEHLKTEGAEAPGVLPGGPEPTGRLPLNPELRRADALSI